LGLRMAAFVLVHGHMHGAWCWDKVVPLLEAQGHRVVTPDLPGRGDETTPHVELTLKRYTDSVAAIVRAMDEPVILVGHSAGGTVLSELAELMPEKIAKLIYVAAILLPDGASLFSTMVAAGPMDPAIVVDGDSACIVDPVLGCTRFYNTCSSEDAAWAFSQLCPEPIPPMTQAVHVTAERFGRVPRAFIQARYDNAVPLAIQQAMCATTPCDPVIVMDTDHSPFLSQPEAFAHHLDALAKVKARSRAA
jgi:pimeloyl-ACP methyl ester carboxylesterase